MNVKYLNEYYLLTSECTRFISWWNDLIHTYGEVTVSDVNDFLGEASLYSHTKWGWVKPITTENFKIVTLKDKYSIHVRCKLKLPKVSLLKES